MCGTWPPCEADVPPWKALLQPCEAQVPPCEVYVPPCEAHVPTFETEVITFTISSLPGPEAPNKTKNSVGSTCPSQETQYFCLVLYNIFALKSQRFKCVGLYHVFILCTVHSVFLSTDKGELMALAAASPWWSNGDQLTGPQCFFWSKLGTRPVHKFHFCWKQIWSLVWEIALDHCNHSLFSEFLYLVRKWWNRSWLPSWAKVIFAWT